ncbi:MULTISPECIES: ABC transporter ATPase [Fluviicola]|uniref:ABC transporter ATPase n=1 Tax=Fluviicola TaxID=332102 RepID=UPI0031381CAD
MIPFDTLDDQAKVWSYQADRLLTETEVQWITEQLNPFLEEWAAHGTKLKAYGEVMNNAHLILAVDESAHNASGCSIDTSVRFIKSLEKELNVSFFNRLKMLTLSDGKFVYVNYADLASLPDETIVFNNTISSVSEFKNSWKSPLKNFIIHQ